MVWRVPSADKTFLTSCCALHNHQLLETYWLLASSWNNGIPISIDREERIVDRWHDWYLIEENMFILDLVFDWGKHVHPWLFPFEDWSEYSNCFGVNKTLKTTFWSRIVEGNNIQLQIAKVIIFSFVCHSRDIKCLMVSCRFSSYPTLYRESSYSQQLLPVFTSIPDVLLGTRS